MKFIYNSFGTSLRDENRSEIVAAHRDKNDKGAADVVDPSTLSYRILDLFLLVVFMPTR